MVFREGPLFKGTTPVSDEFHEQSPFARILFDSDFVCCESRSGCFLASSLTCDFVGCFPLKVSCRFGEPQILPFTTIKLFRSHIRTYGSLTIPSYVIRPHLRPLPPPPQKKKKERQRSFSFTWLATIQISWKKGKFLHEKRA